MKKVLCIVMFSVVIMRKMRVSGRCCVCYSMRNLLIVMNGSIVGVVIYYVVYDNLVRLMMNVLIVVGLKMWWCCIVSRYFESIVMIVVSVSVFRLVSWIVGGKMKSSNSVVMVVELSCGCVWNSNLVSLLVR